MGSFIGLSSLVSLDLSHNHLNVLPTGAFNFLKSLKFLSLAHNKINDLAMNLLRGPQKLHELELDGNMLDPKQLNDMFSDIEHLERLDLNFCNFDDEKISRLKFVKLPNLKRLGLAENNLTNVPSKTIRSIPLLEAINLSHNKIRNLDACSFCGCNISQVFLAHNFLGVDKEAIHPEAFADTKMTELDLSFNYLDQFDASMLAHAQQSLKVLHLSGNSFGGFLHRLTYNLPSLTHLHMAANGLRTIPLNLPYEYRQLNFLNLSGNSLEDLPEDVFQLLPSMRVLDLSFNLFSSFTPSVFASFIGQLEQVYLNDNPWDCRCATQNLQHYMLQRYSYHIQLNYDRTLCAKPQLLKNQPLHKVHYINDCAVLFGATYGLTQTSELVLLLAALVVTSLLIAFLILALLYCGKDRKYKGTYVTREHSRTRLTHPVDCGLSGTTSAMSEPLTCPSSPLPPAPPPPPGSMFVAF
uniref:LRRCT domain-containing protein n=1 Tax=Acrobeloides nanus TaxID=290746 RepID=A0A914C5Q0_9BILA